MSVMVKPKDSRHAHPCYPTDGALNVFQVNANEVLLGLVS